MSEESSSSFRRLRERPDVLDDLDDQELSQDEKKPFSLEDRSFRPIGSHSRHVRFEVTCVGGGGRQRGSRMVIAPEADESRGPLDLSAVGAIPLKYGNRGAKDIPEWSRFLLEVGHYGLSLRSDCGRLVAAIVVPTRAYAAAFLALGAVAGRVAATERAPQLGDSLAHFLELAALSPGSHVTVMIAGKKCKATIIDADTSVGTERLKVCFDKDGLVQTMPMSECGRVSPGAIGRDQLPRPTKKDQQSLGWDPAFVSGALGVTDVPMFARTDDFTALIIGKLQALSFELEHSTFFVGSGRNQTSGHIEDLIRTKKFANDVEGDAFRTEVMSSQERSLRSDLAALKPPLVIFDGGRAFTKHRSSWPDASWIVVLDRSATDCEDGALAFSEFYVQSRVGDEVPLADLEVPPGVEFQACMARRRG